MNDDLAAASRYLAYVLRHKPSAIGLDLGHGGWVPVADLLDAMARHSRPLTAGQLRAVVDTPGKKRFEVRGDLIRAAQGHSVPVDLDLDPLMPPPVLYHGTVARFLPAILAQGLRPGRRVHVHLSADEQTAAVVGARRGEPVILRVDAAGLHAGGHDFFQAANGVWLAGRVPPSFLTVPLTLCPRACWRGMAAERSGYLSFAKICCSRAFSEAMLAVEDTRISAEPLRETSVFTLGMPSGMLWVLV
jgi:putative RNA 2'-phosphotransferase